MEEGLSSRRQVRTPYDIDVLLSHTYLLFTHGGLLPYLVRKVAHLFTEAILYGVLFTLVWCVEWSFILSLNTPHPLSSLFHSPRMNVYSILYVTCVGVIILLRSVLFVGEYTFLRCIDQELHTHGIELHSTKFHKWKNVAMAMSAVLGNDTSSSDVTIANDLEIRMRLLRKENYKVALLTDADLYLPQYTKPIEWLLEHALWSYIFTHVCTGKVEGLTNAEVNAHSEALKQRLKTCAILYGVLSPFIFCYYVAYTIFAYAQQVRITPTMTVDRVWSTEALLYYRNYNELPHEFTERLAEASIHTTKFMKVTSPHYLEHLVKLLLFIVTSLSVCLFIFTLLNGNILTMVTTVDTRGDASTGGGVSVLTLIGISAIVIGSLQSLLPRDEERSETRSEKLWRKVQTSLQLPDHMFCDVEESKVRLSTHFIPRWKKWLVEITSILTAPYVCVALYSQTPAIFSYIATHTQHNRSAGTVCSKSVWEHDVIASSRGDLSAALTNKKMATSIMMYTSKMG